MCTWDDSKHQPMFSGKINHLQQCWPGPRGFSLVEKHLLLRTLRKMSESHTAIKYQSFRFYKQVTVQTSRSGCHAFRSSSAWICKRLSCKFWNGILGYWINITLISFLRPCHRLLPQLYQLWVLSFPFCLNCLLTFLYFFVCLPSFVFYWLSISCIQFPKNRTWHCNWK